MGKMPYQYKEEMDMSRGKPVVRDLDEMGKPVTQPTNMKAAISIDKIYKHVTHIPDEFNREAEQNKQARLDHHKKLGENANMRQMDHGCKTFQTDRNLYSYTGPPIVKSMPKEPELNIYPHDGVFRYPNPAKKV